MADYLSRIQLGNLCLVGCCVFYLVWWSITFNPMRKFPMVPKYILFFVTLGFGVAGVILLVYGMGAAPKERGGLSATMLVGYGVVGYFILLLVTNYFLHRQVTTELLLIVGWTVLELCAINCLYRAGAVNMAPAVILGVVVVAAAVVGMVCYLEYYSLEPVTAFYDGMVPLILFAVVMAVELGVFHAVAAV